MDWPLCRLGHFLFHRFNRFGGFNEEGGASLPVPIRGPAVRHPGAQHQVDRFALSYRDVEDLLAEQRLELNYETVRRRVLKFGPAGARRLRRQPPCPTSHWHVGEMVFRVGGERLYLWRAVDDEGAVLNVLVQRRRNRVVALKLMRLGLATLYGELAL